MIQRERHPTGRAAGAVSIDLLAAAIAGLLGVTGCSSGPTNPDQGERPDGAADTVDASTGTTDAGFVCPSGWTCGPGTSSDAGAPTDAGSSEDATYNILLEAGASFTLEQFQALCDSRGGFFYTNAACAGGSACKGISFHNGDLWDHSCRGQNSECAGANCLDTPKDTGLTGQQIYEQGPCGGCHGLFSTTTFKTDPAYYAVLFMTNDPSKQGNHFDPGTSPEYAAALAQFMGYSEQGVESRIALGVSGVFPDGTGYNNMPEYHQTYSAAEIKRAAQYIRGGNLDGGPGLKIFGSGYPEYQYVTGLPDASAADSSDAGAHDASGD